MISIGRGFFEFSFSSIEDLRRVLAVGSWTLSPGILTLFSWTPDFRPNLVKQTNAQCWIRIHGLPREYWHPKILFAISRCVGIPLSLDDAIKNRSLGHYAKVLVDVDLAGSLHEQVLVEREGFAFKVSIDYERIPCIALLAILSDIPCQIAKTGKLMMLKPRKSCTKVCLKKHDSVLKGRVTEFNKAPASEVVSEPATNKGKEVIVEPSPNVVQCETSFKNHINMPPRFDADVHGPDMVIDVELGRASQENQIIRPVDNLDDQLNKDSTLNDEEEIENVFDERQFLNHNDGVTNNALKGLDRVSNTFSGEEHDMHVEYKVVNSKDS